MLYMEILPIDNKESGVNRVVGIDVDKEKEILEYFKEVFDKNSRESSKEKEKNSEQIELIQRVNKDMGIFLERYGIKSINIPPENIHMLDTDRLTEKELNEIYKRFGTENGFYSSSKQSIVVLKDYNKNKLSFYQTIVHEMLHAQGFYSYQESKEGRPEITLDNKESGDSINMNIRRSGFSIGTKDGKKIFFEDLNESIITELEILFVQEFIEKWPELYKDIKDRDYFIEYSKKHGDDSITERDVASITIYEDSNYEVKSYPYYKERKHFNNLIDKLYESNKENFNSREEIFEMFVKATLSGRIMEIARLIEKTFGKGSFRMIGEESSTRLD